MKKYFRLLTIYSVLTCTFIIEVKECGVLQDFSLVKSLLHANELLPLVTYDPTSTPVTGYKEYILENPRIPFKVEEVLRHSNFRQQKQNKFFVIVNSSLYLYVSLSIDSYVADLEQEGYDVRTYTGLGGTDVDWRTFLQDSSDALVGAVFVGNLPLAWYELDNQPTPWPSYEVFPCDLFFMDMDGEWTDTNPTANCQTGAWDGHFGNVYPEIWIGRLYVSSGMGEEADLINKYFAKAHKYRTGGFDSHIINRVLEYIDDDWVYYWPGGVGAGNAYDSVVVISDSFTTTAVDYRDNRLTGNYAWINLACHSSATTHFFGQSGSQGRVNYTDIKNKKPITHFYCLYACSNCRFTSFNCMGSWYVLVDSCGLAATGSTKTGGMLYYSTLFNTVGANKSYGEALKNWWTANLPCNEMLKRWFYGIVLLGDPAIVPMRKTIGIEDTTTLSREHINLTILPNPFTESVTIRGNAKEVICIYDIGGRLVKSFYPTSDNQQAVTVSWDGTNDIGEKMTAGIYFCQFKGSNRKITEKLIMMR